MGWLVTGWRLSGFDLRPAITRRVGTGPSDLKKVSSEAP